MSTISRNERGQVMAFVVVIVMALLLFVGLVFDGGLILAAKRRAINEAEAAARAGAQAIATNTYRTTGRLTLDPVRARAAARAYLAQTADTGNVLVVGDRVVVTVTLSQRMQLLRLVGIRSVRLQGRGAAVAVHGVEGAES
jgi:Flp pilus assembly protein TadG